MKLLFLVFSLLLLCACNTHKKIAWLRLAQDSYCNPPDSNVIPQNPISHHTDSVLATPAARRLRATYGLHSILTMHALGVLNDVAQLKQLTALNDTLRYRLIQHVIQQVELANSEITAVAAELDCEGERVNQVAQYVDDVNSKTTTRFTVASIAVGAATGIAGALVSKSNLNKGIAIAGGALGFSLGFATLRPSGKKIEMYHKRNLLQLVWTEHNENQIPPFVWYMLTEKQISNQGAASIISNLKQRWILYQFKGNNTEASHSVNFTSGGIYTAEDLHQRAGMINQLQAEVRSINQIINTFLSEFNLSVQ